MSSRTKKIIIVATLIIVLFFLYSYLSHKNDNADELLADSSGLDSNIGNEFIALLAKIKAIKLDESFFTSAAFESLKDSRVTIDPQPAGRMNPFAPIGAPDSF